VIEKLKAKPDIVELHRAIDTDDASHAWGDIAAIKKAAGGKLLPFTLYVPDGFGKVNGRSIPNVMETSDPRLILTAEFDGGREKWQELNWEEMP
jgi:hypothetical protein